MKNAMTLYLTVLTVIVVSCVGATLQLHASPAAPELTITLLQGVKPQAAARAAILQADNPNPPTSTVKLIFIHHSTGGNWLADPNAEQYYGGLGHALMDNNYFVSATNYGWGPDQIGSNTDIGYWWDWFRGDNSITYTAALYSENGQNICNPTANPPYECFGAWPRQTVTPTGQNEIVMFKGCFPNAHLSGGPSDPPTSGDNLLRGQSAWLWDDGLGHEVPNPNHTVANAKGIYNDVLAYFATRQDKLFVVIAGPPLLPDDATFATDAAHAANYRAFNNWLVNDWLDSYPHNNVAVFDYYNILTSNGGDPQTNDAGDATGNHHRWRDGAVQHVSPVNYNFSAYGIYSDSHPTTAGQQKATSEFVQLLNVFYHRWKGSTQSPTPTPSHTPGTPTATNTPFTPTPSHMPGTPTATNTPLTPTPSHTPGTPLPTATSAHDHWVYLPLVLKNASSTPPACAAPLTGVAISGPTSGRLVEYSTFNIQHSLSPQATQPTGLTATHHSGQTFLTWNENTGVSGESYHVYRHSAPINAANIAQATRLTEKWGPLPEGSSIFYTDRDRAVDTLYPGLRNYVITDLGEPLTDTIGLFVWTSKQAGDVYYAITTVEAGGAENLADFSGNTVGPVTENVTDPQPVLVWQSPSGNGRVYTQFMDWARFNPTYERPYAQPDGGLQYAYNYWVGKPSAGQCGGTLPAQLPLYLYLGGHGTRYMDDLVGVDEGRGDRSRYWCAIEIYADDPRQSWYYGFSASYDYRTGSPDTSMPGSGPIANYTEERLLRSIYDTMRNPAYAVDPQRIYVYGHSMGGSGALALAMRYPNVFAASYSSEPMMNYSTSTEWSSECQAKWGSLSANLPISISGRYAAHLAAYNGSGIWDWQNHLINLVSRAGDEMAHISLAHGMLDTVIRWGTQGQPAYGAFYQGRRAFSGATVAADHTWIGFAGMGPNVAELDYAPFYGFAVVRDESLPGLTNASGSSSTPPANAISATYNLNLEWSASWDSWDGAPVDTASQWRISLRTTDAASQTVDVTPRRLQTFSITPSANYTWENRRVSDNGLVASGVVAAAGNGLVTVEDFAVSASGNRLVLRPAGGPVQPALTLTAPNGGERWQVGSQHQIQWTTTGNVPNVGLSYSTDHFATSHEIASVANTGSYNWTTPITPSTSMRVRVASVVSPTTVHDESNADFTLYKSGGPTGYIFTATLTPANATPPITYTWSPSPHSGQGTPVASYQWSAAGVYVITVTVANCGGAVVGTHIITITSAPTSTVRLMPDTTQNIHIFNDQLAASMSEKQFQFAATHYDGTQKMTRADADHLRSYNPNFVILHYRLGMGLGYRAVQGACEQSGEWLHIIEGDEWIQEWPGDANVSENWFYHWPESGIVRVLNCDWGWYLMNLDHAAWRTFWSGEVLRQLQANADDGIFADSFSVPNYLGFDHYNPNLPELNNTFESQWATRLENFMTFVQQGSLANYYFIPNAGQWVTSRETTDYSIADGVMIEGFGGWGNASYFELSDWRLQMNRILGLVNQDKIILAQQYIDADNVNDRMFLLGNYLLIKGRYTYLNFELDLEPEWFPEYGLPVGSPAGASPANIEALWNSSWGVYSRTYSNGLVLVNPTTVTQTIHLSRTYYQAMPHGGGFIPGNGDVSAWTVSYTPVTSVTLAPNRAAILLNSATYSDAPVYIPIDQSPQTRYNVVHKAQLTLYEANGTAINKYNYGSSFNANL